MRPIGGPAPRYQPPEPSTQASASRSTQQPQAPSNASEEAPVAPTLGNLQRYPGGRYAHLGEAIVHMKVADPGKKRQGEHGASAATATPVATPQNVASSSRQIAGGTVESVFCTDLAELASRSERTHTYLADPAVAYGHAAKVPHAIGHKILGDAKRYIESRLQPHGLKLDDVLTKATDKRLEINLNYLEMRDYVGREGFWVQADGDRLREKLMDKADAYLNHFLALDLPALAPLPGLKSKNSLGVMRELLQDAPGLVIGEAHSSKSSKRVVIDNIKALKAAGVTTLYLEHLCADSHGKALDDYLAAPKGSPMPARLKVYLDTLTMGNLPPNAKKPAQGFTELVQAAKEGGLNIIPLDTAETYATSEASGNTRTKVMNYYAAEKIRLSKPEGKWIAFVGSTHATTFKEVPGLAQLHGVRSLIVDDFGSKARGAEIEVNVEGYGEEINPDVVMSYKG
ncbi:membrane-targeted effector domain-containing toxin [Pseudomonas sp. Z1-12]|uniref:membrane-targeted effector domain-containing toxin n=1 Tax=Pseudomonas sp. Z1-12 TaxID=2817408 RepID=UPI003DA977A8